MDLTSRFSLYPSVPAAIGPSWLAYSVPYPKRSSSGSWTALPYIIQPFSLPVLFVFGASWLVPLVPLSSLSLPLPVSPHELVQSSHVYSGPSQMSRSLPLSGSPTIYNKLSPLRYLGAVTLPFLFISLFHAGTYDN